MNTLTGGDPQRFCPALPLAARHVVASAETILGEDGIDAARTAARAGMATLVLTHYVPGLPRGAEDEWRALAAAHFGGNVVVVGDDLTTVEV